MKQRKIILHNIQVLEIGVEIVSSQGNVPGIPFNVPRKIGLYGYQVRKFNNVTIF